MHIRVWSKTDTGLKRETNQDSFLVSEKLNLFVVADGMGGHNGGEVASSLAVQTAEEIVARAQRSSTRDLIDYVYAESSRRIFDKANFENLDLQGMGTTMVLSVIDGASIYIGNVGDSRCYLYRDSKMWQLTEDHSLLNENIRSGRMTEEEAKVAVARNVITKSVGFERDVIPDILEREIQPGDIYLLCSDGLTSMVPDARLREILRTTPPDLMAESCVREALARGGDDNVTVLVLACD